MKEETEEKKIRLNNENKTGGMLCSPILWY